MEETNMPEMVTVNKVYFNAIEKNSEFLEYLDAYGVTGWDGYSEACAAYQEDQVQLDGEEY
jgi:hypothetical protein